MRHTRRDFLICSSLTTAALAFPESSFGADPLKSSIRDAVQASLQTGGCPGVSVGIAKGENVVLRSVAGMANIETGTALSENSVFRVGSLTKQFTAVCILKLVEQGKLALDAPASSYLSCFSSSPKFTVRELLNHTAGIHSEEGDTFVVYDTERSQIALAQEIAAQKQVFDFPPGTAWLYSNANYILLGALIESVSSKPLTAVLDEMIFQPLGLNATAFDHSAAVVAGRVSGYTPTGNPKAPFENAQWIPIEEAGGAGGLRSSIGDLCKWHDRLFDGRVLTRDSLGVLLAPGKLRSGELAGTHRFSPDDEALGDVQYAMGFLVPPPGAEGKTAIHYGYINGFSACLERFVDQRITLAIVCNADKNPGLPFREIRKKVRENLAHL